MGDVVVLKGLTTLGVPVDRVLDGAAHLETVLVLGYDKDGAFWASTNVASKRTAEVVNLAQRFVHKYYDGDYE